MSSMGRGRCWQPVLKSVNEGFTRTDPVHGPKKFGWRGKKGGSRTLYHLIDRGGPLVQSNRRPDQTLTSSPVPRRLPLSWFQFGACTALCNTALVVMHDTELSSNCECTLEMLYERTNGELSSHLTNISGQRTQCSVSRPCIRVITVSQSWRNYKRKGQFNSARLSFFFFVDV